MAASVAAICTGLAAQAQTNGLNPANLPPAAFEGREFVDSAGCAFLRSTFGGEVTWIPRYGTDRNPVCDLSPTVFASDTPAAPATSAPDAPSQQASAAENAAPAADAEQADPETTETTAAAPADTTAAPRGRIEIVGAVRDPVRRVAPSFLGKEPPRSQPPRRAKPRYPVADASGRHPSCPGSAPFGQLVNASDGRKLVRCVTEPALFLGKHETEQTQLASVAQHDSGGQGLRVQVGSFSVPANAHRLVSRLQAHGLPASQQTARGLRVVSVGPFSGGAEAQSALAQVRAMGFHDAFLRR